MADKPKSEWQEREIGAFWTKTAKSDGKKFWTGDLEIEGKLHKVVMYANDKKTDDKQPSLRVYLEKVQENAIKPVQDDFPE
jgi:uncharacterized protein (DUF736 family)